MEKNIEIGEVVFFLGAVSPWFFHKGEVSKIDEKKGYRIGNMWYTANAIMKETPDLADHILIMNIRKSAMMCKGEVQYEGETLDSYLIRIRAVEDKPEGEKE